MLFGLNGELFITEEIRPGDDKPQFYNNVHTAAAAGFFGEVHKVANCFDREITCAHAAIVMQLCSYGNCCVKWCGKMLEFVRNVCMIDFFVDGDYADSVADYSLIREFLENIAEVYA